MIKSPLNYIGGKYKILKQILPLFPEEIDNFVDLFGGGFNVGINVNANKIYYNDNLTYLVDMYRIFQSKDYDLIINFIDKRIKQYKLSLTNDEGYKKLRELYNKKKNPLDLFVLIAHSFNHQIRFNNNHYFNNPFGRNRSSFNERMRQNLFEFIARLKEIEVELSDKNFENFNYSNLSDNDFVYCDPPYLITTGTYNDGKRGFTGWSLNEEKALLSKLDELDEQGVRFALSNVLQHKGKSNELLINWITRNRKYAVNHLDYDYSNSNYQTIIRDKNASVEVLITNYLPKVQKTQNLFSSLEVCGV